MRFTVNSFLATGVASLALVACASAPAPEPVAPAPAPIASSAAPVPAPAQPSAAAVAATPAPLTSAAPAPEPKPEPKMHHPGIGMLMLEVADVGLKPEQKSAVDALKADLAKLEDGTKEGRAQLKSDVADGVAAGKLDKAKIDADTKKLVKAAESTASSVQEAMNKLHKTLDPEQRKKLVELMHAKAETMHEHAKAETMHEHGKAEGHERGKAEGHEHGEMGEHAMGPHKTLEKLSEELALTADQKDKLKTKMDALMKTHMAAQKGHFDEMQKRMKAVGDAFAGDKFDAKNARVGEKLGDMIQLMTKHRVQFVEAVLSVLTPEQRTKFAAHVRQHSEPGED